MPACKLFVPALLLMLCAVDAQAQESYRLQAPPEIEKFLRSYLPAADQSPDVNDDYARLGLARRLRQQALDLLATEGYFTPQITVSAESPMLLQITPGPRTQVSDVEIIFTGELGTQEEFRGEAEALKADWSLKVGDAFRDRDWSSAKEKLLQQIAAHHFATARINESQADVDPDRAQAHLRVVLDSGPAYQLGALNIEGLHDYTPSLVARYNPNQTGDEYSLERLQAFQTALQSSPYFSYVEVSADTAHATGNTLPVKVLVQEAKPKRFSAGVGYSSNTGARFELGFKHANLFNQAWQLNSGVRIESNQQSAFADIFLPPDNSAWRNSLGGVVEASYISGLRLHQQTVGVARSIQQDKTNTRFGLSLQSETTQPDGAERSHTQALALDWQWTWRQLDNALDPHRGYSVNLRLSTASQYLLSDTDFLRSWARLAGWYPLSAQDVIGVRAESGYTVAQSRSDVPQDFLFRTGGAQSVRGYGYLSLGAHQGDAVVGGRYMGAASAEYTHWFAATPWGIAGFTDIGDAGDRLQSFRAYVGSGIGGRWRSPAGPLALDVAYGWRAHGWRAHLSVALVF